MNEPASDSPPQGPPGSSAAGKLIAIGLPLVIVLVTVVLGAVFTRRDRRHREGRLEGKALYTKYCTACHQASGQGKPSMNVPSLFPFDLEPEEFTTHVQTGKGAMPGFKSSLFDSDYERLYRYVQSLEK